MILMLLNENLGHSNGCRSFLKKKLEFIPSPVSHLNMFPKGLKSIVSTSHCQSSTYNWASFHPGKLSSLPAPSITCLSTCMNYFTRAFIVFPDVRSMGYVHSVIKPCLQKPFSQKPTQYKCPLNSRGILSITNSRFSCSYHNTVKYNNFSKHHWQDFLRKSNKLFI